MKCKADTTRGPCNRPVKPGSEYCRQHCRDKDLANAYRLSDPSLQEAADYHARASLTDISQQIVLMRSLIERRLNMAGDDEANQITAFNFVANQLVNLTKMTESLVKLSKDSGDFVSKIDMETYVDGIIGIVIEEISDRPGFEDVIDQIVSRIGELEDGTQKPSDE